MKKVFNFIREKINNIRTKMVKSQLVVVDRAKALATGNAGESESTGSTALIIGALVVGALVIGLIIVLFRDTLWPLVTEAAKKLFNIE